MEAERQVALLQHDPHGLHETVAAAALPDGLCDAPGDLHVRGAQVDVVGDERHPRADHHGPRGGMGLGRTEVGLPERVAHPLGEALELAAPHVLEVAPVGGRGRLFVEEHGDLEALRHRLAHVPGQRHAVLHGRALDGDERHDVHGAHARVLALVAAQVDAAYGHLEEREQAGPERRLVADQGQDAAVVVLVGLDVEDAQARDRLQGRDRGVDHLGAPSLADVGDRLDDPRHGPSYHNPPPGPRHQFFPLKRRVDLPIMIAFHVRTSGR